MWVHRGGDPDSPVMRFGRFRFLPTTTFDVKSQFERSGQPRWAAGFMPTGLHPFSSGIRIERRKINPGFNILLNVAPTESRMRICPVDLSRVKVKFN